MRECSSRRREMKEENIKKRPTTPTHIQASQCSRFAIVLGKVHSPSMMSLMASERRKKLPITRNDLCREVLVVKSVIARKYATKKSTTKL